MVHCNELDSALSWPMENLLGAVLDDVIFTPYWPGQRGYISSKKWTFGLFENIPSIP